MKYTVSIYENEHLIEVIDANHICVDNQNYEIDFHAVGDQTLYSLLIDGCSYESEISPSDESLLVLLQGRVYPVIVEDERANWLRLASQSENTHHGEYLLKAPMPGSIIALPVQDGQAVKKGEVLVILESMKMQNELRSPREGTIARLRVKIGDDVEQKQILLAVI